ncbi:NPCBM/NEW2 domain-containing protein [Psychrobacillus sp.]|uniref:NPCBM/NEW2 domain-containing protein n=1 Tax=Psychrobacillus sp. TaxID=1871623 RepID=UPI0028BEEF5E|nr:NPCBM/NEW2 domain-containing protein [Psychrobacillus sp.]
MTKFMTIATSAVLFLSILSGSVNVVAQEFQNEATTAVENEVSESSKATVSKFDSLEADILNSYNQVFKVERSKIESITNNGGKYVSSVIENAIDGNMNTHWETGRENNSEFKNEIVFQFNEPELLNRIVYAARQSSAKGKGFAQEFEIHSSTTDEGEFQLVSSGEYKGSTGDTVEIQFAPTEFKRIKFVFTKANQNWASAAEFCFYKEDLVKDQMKKLFVDNTFSTVSDEFNTLEKLEALEEGAKTHLLYPQFKEDIANAKQLIIEGKLESTIAVTKSFNHYTNEDYSKLFRMGFENIKSIRNNGGHYSNAVIGNAVDGNLKTYWETNKTNSKDFINEIEVEFKEAVKLNRVIYGARESDRKGFAEEFEIYASKTSKGDTYELVANGKHNMIAGLVEAKFEPIEFKRVKFKFKKSNQNWATVSELAFYKEDVVSDKIGNLFADGTMSKVIDEYNSIEKLNALENEAKAHPLYASNFKEIVDLAKLIVNGDVETEGTLVVAEQRGDMVKHANQKLKFGFGNNLQPTGFAAQPGDKITVYVDADSNAPLPKLSFAQQEGAWSSWRKDVSLVVGKNVIAVPKINRDSWYKKAVTPGGSIYIINPYTAEEQGNAPTIRFEGVEKIPFATVNTNVEEFKSFLTEYKRKIDEDVTKHPNVEDREVLDVFEFVSDHIFWTGTATGAYKTYIEDGYSPLETIESYNIHMEEIFRYYGLDASSESHDPKLIRENVRLAQPYAYMYAAGGHIGTLDDVVANHLIPFEVRGPSWGLTHEIGHKMDVNVRLYGETTNNMLPQYMSTYYNQTNMRIPYEANVYKNVLKENLTDYNAQGVFEKLAVYWQLELYSPGYWGKLNRVYRERNVQLTNGESSKQQYLVEFSSEVLEQDLSEYFARHGFVVDEETREKTSKYPKPTNKIWYLNDYVVGYTGKGIEDKNAMVGVSLVSNSTNKTNTLNFSMDKQYKEDFLGYEIIRNGEIVGFTSSNSFIDKDVDTSRNYTYQVVVYDKKLNTLKPVEFKSFKPALSVEESLTLKLRQEFDPMDYVKATNYRGNDITPDVVVKSSNVDVTNKGEYEVVYEITNADAKETKKTKVTVVSDYVYISDMNAQSVKVGWSELKKDKAPSGGPITLLRQALDVTYSKGIGVHANSEVVYNIEGKGFDFFESYIGIDQAMKEKASSATFEVWIDGEKKFDSKVFNSNTDHEYVKVPVTGAKEVKLVTTDAKNNGNTADHTVWADAKLVENSSSPTLTIPKSAATKVGEPININGHYSAMDAEDGDLTSEVQVIGAEKVSFNRAGKYELTYVVTDSDGNETQKTRTISVVNMEDYKYLSNFDWKSTQNSYTGPLKDISISAKTLRLTDESNQEVTYEKGIGAHSNSTIVYDLTDKNSDYFTSFVGVDRQMFGTVGSVIFQVFVDGEKQFDSGLMNSREPQKFVEVSIAGARELKLVVTDGGNGNGSDHATWGDAKLHYANSERVFTIDLEKAVEDAKVIDKEQYTSESFEALQNAIERAKEVLANKESTQIDVDNAIALLNKTKNELVEIDVEQIITIQDKYLSDSIKKTLGVTGDITLGDMLDLTTLTSESRRARSLEGLQYAKNLVTLDLSGNEIMDFSPLKDLQQLQNIIANPQIIEHPELKGPIVEFNNQVKWIDGNHVIPKQVGVRHTQTNKEILFDVSELAQNPPKFTLDLSSEDKGYYMLVLVYEVEGNLIQIVSFIDNL